VDALSRLGILNNAMDEEHFTDALCSELYAFDDEDWPETAFPLSYAFLGKAQSTDIATLTERAKTKSLYSIRPFTGAGKTRELICYSGKVMVPRKLQPRVIRWYHGYLGHDPSINRTKETIGQHLCLVAKNEESNHKLGDSLLHMSTKQGQGFQEIWTPPRKGSRSNPLG
jgi:hypothetical protein